MGVSDGAFGPATRSAVIRFQQAYGPGYSGHNDHTHLGATPSRSWQAPSCGI